MRRLVAYTDGGSRGNPGVAGCGAVVTDAETGAVLAERAEYLGQCSNNVAEYRGVVAALEAAKAIDPDARVEVRADSKLVVEQMSGRWKIKHPDMKELARRAKEILPAGRVTFTWVPRAQNAAADALANKAMDQRASTSTDVWCDADGDTAGDGAAGARDSSGDPVPRPDGAGASDGDETRERPLHVPMGRPAGTPATLVLVRHGVTDETLGHVMAGGDTPGPDLAEAGRAQARRAARILSLAPDTWAGVDAPSVLLTSPLVRTRATAALIGEHLGLEPRDDDRLREVRFGHWQGRPSAEVEADARSAEALAAFIATGRDRAPGGESLLEVGRRMGTLMTEVAAEHTGATVAAVSHSVAIRCALGLALGADPSRWWMIRIPPASVSVVRLWPARDPGSGPDVEIVAVGVPSELLAD